MKSKRQFSSLYVDNLDEARAAAAAGIDMLGVAETLWSPEWREAAGSCFVQVSLSDGVRCTYEDYIRAAHQAMQRGGDCVYTSASTEIIRRLAAEGIPVVSHLGLIPRKCTWTGGFVAVDTDADLCSDLPNALSLGTGHPNALLDSGRHVVNPVPAVRRFLALGWLGHFPVVKRDTQVLHRADFRRLPNIS